jgi:hypothetical protein
MIPCPLPSDRRERDALTAGGCGTKKNAASLRDVKARPATIAYRASPNLPRARAEPTVAPLQDDGSRPSAGEHASAAPTRAWHSVTCDDALTALGAAADGLAAGEAAARLSRWGANVLPAAEWKSALKRFLAQFHNLLIYVLLGSAAITLRKKGDGGVLDSTGTDPQLVSALNMPTGGNERHAPATVGYICARYTLDPTISLNAGTAPPARPILPKGTVVNCEPPAAVGMRSLLSNVTQTVFIGAFSQAIPDRMPAAAPARS